MKNYLSGTLLVALTTLSQAGTISLKPAPADLRDLDHKYAYTWGAEFSVSPGDPITSAQLVIADIWDWQVETDALFVHLLDWARIDYKSPGLVKQNLFTFEDNTADNVIEDWFNSPAAFEATGGASSQLLGVFSDPIGGDASQATQLVFSFNAEQLSALNAYIQNDGRFGFGFDPDCYYFNNGATLYLTTGGSPSITSGSTSVPDSGSSAVLLCLGMTALAGLRRKFRA